MSSFKAFDLPAWLAEMGLAAYAPAFIENHIDLELLASLTGDDLREVGVVSVGHRKRLLEAIARLSAPRTAATPEEPVAASVATTGGALASPQRHAAAQASATVQRREITVMFCDLVGSTALAAKVDPEDLLGYIATFRTLLTQIIEEHKGWVAQYLGDGVMAYFGYPQARDYDTERAVRAALDIVRQVAQLPPFGEQQPQVRIGIATGITVVGKPFSTGEHAEENAIGETPNLAARAQAMAEPDTVVIAPSTQRRIADFFECSDLGSFTVKGFQEPMHLWRVLQEKPAGSRFDATHSGRQQDALVGRDAEMQQIKEHARAVRTGQGRVLVIRGDSGMGKSRLMGDAMAQMGKAAQNKLVFQCSPYNVAAPLHPVRSFVERRAGIVAGQAPELALDKLQSLLELAGAHSDHNLALMADMLGIKMAADSPLQGLGSHELRAMTFTALIDLFALLAKQALVVVIEDLHWIDASTSELFGNLTARLSGLPILLVATTRPGPLPQWAETAQAHVIQLERLDRQQVRSLVRTLAHPLTLPDSVQDAIVARSDGVPIFAEELTRGYLQTAARSTSAHSLLSIIPSTLTESLLARLDSFECGREIAPVAAVIGREFPVELLIAVSPLDEHKTRQGVQELLQAGVFVAGHSRYGAAVAFRHMLVYEAAYSLLVRRERQRLHALVADTLESQFPVIAKAAPQVMAIQLAAAGQAGRAMVHLERAGSDADRRSAYLEAIEHFQQALSMNQEQAASRARDEQEFALRVSLMGPLIAVRGHRAPEVELDVNRIAALSESLDNKASVVPAMAMKLLLLATAGNQSGAYEMAQRIQIAAAGGSEVDQLIAHRYMSTILLFRGQFPEGVAQAEQFLAHYNPQIHAQAMEKLGPTNHQVMVMVGLAQAYTLFDQNTSARLWRDKTLAEARSKANAHTLCNTLAFGDCLLSALNEEEGELTSRANELQHLMQQHSLPTWTGHADLFVGLSLILQQRAEEGFVQARRGVDFLVAAHAYSDVWYVLYAQACQRHGRVDEGLEVLAIAEQFIASGLTWMQAEYLRLRALLHHARGDAQALVQADLHAAIALAHKQGAVLFEKRAQRDLAQLYG
jgi:class 3 adenylate cyclase